jgi:hypothetical protein
MRRTSHLMTRRALFALMAGVACSQFSWRERHLDRELTLNCGQFCFIPGPMHFTVLGRAEHDANLRREMDACNIEWLTRRGLIPAA